MSETTRRRFMAALAAMPIVGRFFNGPFGELVELVRDDPVDFNELGLKFRGYHDFGLATFTVIIATGNSVELLQCPKCGSTDIETTCIGYLPGSPNPNRRTCGCGWSGSIDESERGK